MNDDYQGHYKYVVTNKFSKKAKLVPQILLKILPQ